MIVFDLTCAQGHIFEGWFRDSAAFVVQKDAGDIVCPVCADCAISKAPMAPHLSTRGGSDETESQPARVPAAASRSANLFPANDRRRREEVFHAPAEAPPSAKAATLAVEAARALRALRDEVAKSCDYVGEKFAEEARKMHYGEAEKRSIYGETTFDEAKELRDEGIEIQPLPRLPRENA
jgi:hypothetical protein